MDMNSTSVAIGKAGGGGGAARVCWEAGAIDRVVELLVWVAPAAAFEGIDSRGGRSGNESGRVRGATD